MESRELGKVPSVERGTLGVSVWTGPGRGPPVRYLPCAEGLTGC